jgi:hypothetical protein
MKARGFTLVEALIACSMFLVMLGSLFSIYRMGATIWLRSDTGAEILGQVQSLSAKIAREAERSLFDSLAIESSATKTGCSLLSAHDANGRFDFDPGTRMPRWQTAILFYFDKAAETVYRLEVPIAGATPRENLLLYGQNFVRTPSGPARLLPRFVGGQPVATKIKAVSFEKPTREVTLSGGRGDVAMPLRCLRLKVRVEKPRFGGGTQAITSETVSYFRN